MEMAWPSRKDHAKFADYTSSATALIALGERMLEFQSCTARDNSGDCLLPKKSEEYQYSCQYFQAAVSRETADSDSGSLVMSDRSWLSLHEEPEQTEEQPQHEQHQHLPPPITLPLFQAQQHQPPPPYHSMAVPTHLQAASTYQSSSFYGIDPALAGYHMAHQYGQGYGSASAFRFPPPHEHFQQHQPPFSTAGFGFGRAGLIGDVSGSSRSSFQRPRLSQLGRTFSSPEMPTPPPTMMSASAFSAPASAALFPPPAPPNGHGQHAHSFAAADRTTSASTVHSFFDPYYASVSGLFFQHHQQQQSQHFKTPSPSASEGHSPAMSGISSQTMPLLSPFGDTSFVFQPPSGSPTHGHGQLLPAHAGLLGQQQMICAVCGDTAACLHYGVRTCEGCKGFFKRTVQKNAKYVCLGNRDCIIDKRRRNRCQYCRFQKCLNVGMVREVVRTDSLKGRRGRLPSKSKLGSGDEAGPSASGGFIVAQSLTKALINAYTGDGAAHMAVASVRLGTSSQFIDSLRVSLQVVHQYADRIPGWSSIVDQDRMRLLKRFGVRTMSLRWAYKSMAVSGDDKLLTDDGLVYTLEECPLAWQAWFQSVLALSVHFRTVLELDVTSFSCLCALSLIFQDCNGLQRVEDVDKLKNNIINCLKEHCAYSTEAKNKPQYFARILSVLTELNTVSQYAKLAYASIFGDMANLEDRPSTSSVAPLSLTFFDESFLE